MLNEERVDIIDENNVTIGTATRRESYEKCLPHRVVHVLVFEGESVYLVRRSMNVRYLPGFYCSSAGGHVHAGEKIETAALRELEEEIGLAGPVSLMAEFFFTHEFKIHVSVFKKVLDCERDKIRINPDEVLEGRFYRVEEAEALPTSLFHPQLVPCLEIAKTFLLSKKG